MIFNRENLPAVPSSWATVRVDEACTLVSVREKIQTKDYLNEGSLAVVDQGSALVGGYWDNASTAVDTELPVVVFGDHTRALKFVDFPFAAGADGIKVLRPSALFHPRLFYRFLEAIKPPSRGYARHFQLLRDSQIPVPPLSEQKRIADKLDTVLARVDACRDHLDRVPAILKRFRQSVLAAAISGKLTEEWRAGSGKTTDVRSLVFEEDSVAIPKHWHDYPLTELIDSQRPLCYGVVQPGEAATDGVPLVRVQDMERGTVNLHGLRTVSADVDAEYRRSRVKSGDLLVSVVGTIGRTAIVPSGFKANIARAVARIACRGGVDSRWVNIWLTSDELQWWMTRSSREVARKTLNLSELSAARVAVPPFDEQLEIVRRVESLFGWADRLEARHAAARAHVERLTPALLAKAFRGELVPQDPADEPASELLERLGQRPADNPTGLPKPQGAKRSRANAAQAASRA